MTPIDRFYKICRGKDLYSIRRFTTMNHLVKFYVTDNPRITKVTSEIKNGGNLILKEYYKDIDL